MGRKVCSIICGAPNGKITAEDIEGLVIAADRGLEYALSAGITPDIVVGDFDSSHINAPEGIECIRVSPIKDDTDAQLAADTAIERGCDELRFFCALGGRLDHTVANIQMMYGLMLRGVKSTLYGAGEKAYLLSNGSAEVPRFKGYLSVFSYGEHIVVSEAGTKYPLDHYTITNSFPLGVSNEVAEETAVVTVHEGTALIIEHIGME